MLSYPLDCKSITFTKLRVIKVWLVILATLPFHLATAQPGIIKGRVYNALNNEPLPFANILVQGGSLTALADSSGNYTIRNVIPGLYNLVASFAGYTTKTLFEIQVNNLQPSQADFPMESSSANVQQVEIIAKTG